MHNLKHTRTHTRTHARTHVQTHTHISLPQTAPTTQEGEEKETNESSEPQDEEDSKDRKHGVVLARFLADENNRKRYWITQDLVEEMTVPDNLGMMGLLYVHLLTVGLVCANFF
jgi:hypothetical protein